MSSELAISQPSQINLSSFKSLDLISEYKTAYNELVNLNKLYIENTYAYGNYGREISKQAEKIKNLGNQTDANSLNIKIHSYYQNLTDSFLGNAKLDCFSPAIKIVNEIQTAFSNLLEGDPDQLNNLNLPYLLREAGYTSNSCNFVYNMATSMDSNITAAFDSIFNINDTFETALCTGDCKSIESDDAYIN